MQGADLVARRVAQVGEVEARLLTDAGRILDRRTAGRDAGRVPRIALLRTFHGKADGAAVRAAGSAPSMGLLIPNTPPSVK